MDGCRILPWDTRFFGFPIGRLEAPGLQAGAMGEVDEWCRREGIRCLYWLVGSDDAASIRAAERGGFRLVDLRVTCAGRPGQTPLAAGAPVSVRAYSSPDLPAMRAIGRSAFVGTTRFFADTRFPVQRVIEMYDTWVVQSCSGDAQHVLVAEADGMVAGFVTCHLDAGRAGRIGLTAVSGAHQGAGIGLALVRGALAWFQSAGAATVSVVTQGHNTRAQRLYQRCGLRTEAVQLWYHYWPDSKQGIA